MAGADGRGLARPEPPRPRRREEWWGGQRSPRHSSSRAPGAPERSRGAPAEASPALPRLGACGRARRTGVPTVGGTEPLTARRCALPGPQRPHHGVDEPTCARQRGADGRGATPPRQRAPKRLGAGAKVAAPRVMATRSVTRVLHPTGQKCIRCRCRRRPARQLGATGKPLSQSPKIRSLGGNGKLNLGRSLRQRPPADTRRGRSFGRPPPK